MTDVSAPPVKKNTPTFKALDPDDPLRKSVAEASKKKSRLPIDQPRTQSELRTTTCSIYLGNLAARLTVSREKLAAKPDDVALKVKLAGQVFSRGKTFGDLAMMQEAIEMVSVVIEKNPDNAVALKERGQMQQTMHRFAEAQSDFAKAKALQPSIEGLDALVLDLKFSTGEDSAATLEAMKKSYQRDRSFAGYVSAAKAHQRLGEFALADRYFGQAERRFEGVAPVPLAWLNVQRGLMAMHTGDYPRAKRFFEVAYERCPEYPMAAEHLAEIEGRLGNSARSIELYEAVVEQTQNPEFMAALAERLIDAGHDARGRALIEEARAINDAAIVQFPEAMYWHAADFFMGPGEDPARALELLEKNFALRPNAEAHQALAEARLANKDAQGAAATVTTMLALPDEFAEKYWTAARVALANNDGDRAREMETKARALNPKIEDLEGPL